MLSYEQIKGVKTFLRPLCYFQICRTRLTAGKERMKASINFFGQLRIEGNQKMYHQNVGSFEPCP